MKHLDLFSGIGGFALACEWVGIETIGFVEIDKYCQKVLRKHWPNVPIVGDIRDVKEIKRIVANSHIRRLEGSSSQGERANNVIRDSGETGEEIKEIVTNAECRPCQAETNRREECQQNQQGKMGKFNMAGSGEYRIISGTKTESQSPAILITAGFPCQPFSVAGKRQGEGDDRYLWPETLAVIEAIKPTWVLLENVTGIKSVYQPNMLSDVEGREYTTEEEAKVDSSGVFEREATNTLWLVLEGLRGAGYEVEVLVIPACAVNAWHRRDRVWIIANNAGYRCNSGATLGGDRFNQMDQDRATTQGEQTREGWLSESREIDNVPDTKHTEITRQRGHSGQIYGITESEGLDICDKDWWAVEPKLGRVAHGIPNRVDRLKCLGNAIVPQVAYEIIKVIKEYERTGL